MKTVIDFFRRSVGDLPDKTALIFENRELSYKELGGLVDSFSDSLIKLENESVVSLFLENSIEFVISYLGVLNAGMIPHLIPINLTIQKIQQQLENANSKFIISSDVLINKLNNIQHECKIKSFSELNIKKNNYLKAYNTYSDIAYLIFTSGTTGLPKGVSITQSNTIFTTKNIINVLKYDKSDVNVLPLPLTHSFGLGCLHASIFLGSTLILLKNATDTMNILEILKKHNATTLAAVPLTLNKILREHKNCSEYLYKLRLIITNSTSVPIKTVREYKKILKKGNLATYYGLTEASRSTFMIFDKLGKETSVGKPSNGIQIKIKNESLNELETGEILIKGENVIKNYWKNLDADKKIFNDWLQTGDLGHKDSEGYLYLDGRIDDVINIAGEKVVPDDIETIVRVLIDVEDVVVVGMKNEMYGEMIKMFVKKSTNSKITKSEILGYCIKHLESHKIPRQIEFLDDFPRNEFGKIERFKLK